MINRKEFDQAIQNKLVEKYGEGEFRATWHELAELLELPLAKTKYHIYKFEDQGILKVISRSQRSGGYTSPNVIRILCFKDSEDSGGSVSKTEAENVLAEADKYLNKLKAKLKSVENYEIEIRKLTKEKHELEAINKRLYNEALQLREKVYELTRLGS